MEQPAAYSFWVEAIKKYKLLFDIQLTVHCDIFV